MKIFRQLNHLWIGSQNILLYKKIETKPGDDSDKHGEDLGDTNPVERMKARIRQSVEKYQLANDPRQRRKPKRADRVNGDQYEISEQQEYPEDRSADGE